MRRLLTTATALAMLTTAGAASAQHGPPESVRSPTMIMSAPPRMAPHTAMRRVCHGVGRHRVCRTVAVHHR